MWIHPQFASEKVANIYQTLASVIKRKSRLQIDGNFGCLKDRSSVCLKDGSSRCLKGGSSGDVILWSSLSNLDLIFEVTSTKSEIYPLWSVRWLACQTNFYVKRLYVAKPLTPIFLSHLSYDSRRNLEKRLFLKESNPYALSDMKSKLFIKRVTRLNN